MIRIVDSLPPETSPTEEPGSGEPFREIIDRMHEAVWLTDPDCVKALYVSQAYEALWGRSRISLCDAPNSWLEAVHGDDQAQTRRAAAAAAAGELYECEYRIVRPDGATRWIRHRGFPIQNGGPEEWCYACIAEDVTELKLEQEEFERFFNSSPDLNAIIGFDGYIKRINTPRALSPGLSRKVLRSKPLLDFIHPDDRERARFEIEQMISDGETHSLELRSVKPDGSYRWLWWTGTAYPDRQLIYATARDVHEQHLAQEMLALRVRQQTSVAELGARALASKDIQRLMDEAVSEVASVLRLEFVGILELQRDKPEFLLRAGHGWETGIVGNARVSAEPDTLSGYMMSISEPVIVADLRGDTRFPASVLAHAHHAVSALVCMIPDSDRPYGALGAFSTQPRTFTEDDIHFLQGIAHILAAAIERQEAQQELDRFFTPAMNPMFIGGFDGYVKRVNHAAEIISGFSSAEIMAAPMLNLVHPDDRAAANAELQKLAAGGMTAAIEFRVLCRDGSYKWTHWSATPFMDQGVFYAVGYDVSDRHAAEAALAEREAEIRTLLDSLAEGVFGVDLEGKCTFNNAACRRLLGYDAPEDLLGKTMHDVMHHSYADGTPMPREQCHVCRASHENREAHVSDEVLWRRDGTSFPAEYFSHPIHKNDKIAGCVVSFLDISLRVQATAERDRFFNHPLTPMCVLGFDGNFKNMNPVCASMFGYSRDELLGQPFLSAVHSEDREQAAAAVQRMMKGGASESYEIRILCKDGSYRWMSWSAVPFPEQQAFYAIGHDVTARRVAEESLAERARQQQAVAELGDVALTGGGLAPLYDEAVAMLARTLRAEFATFLELQPQNGEFLFKAGYGWEPEFIGNARMPSNTQFLCGYVLASDLPVVVDDLAAETRFRAHPLAGARAVRSEMACVVPGLPQSHGVLCVHCRQPRRFTEDDVHFLQSVANILAAAIERARAEEELNRFFEPSLNPMFVGGFDGMIKRCNPSLEQLTGCSREELLSRPIVSFIHPDDQASVVGEIQKLAAGGLTEAFECRVARKDGSYRWALWNGTSFPNNPTFYATGQDVTARHWAEEALRASEETLRATGESALDGIIRLDAEGKVAQWNTAAERMFGFSGGEILGRNLHDVLVPADSRERYQLGWPQFHETGQGPVIGKVQELEAVHKDGSRFPVEVSVAAVSLRGQWHAVGIVRDITERKRVEADLLEAKRAAEAADRSKSEFLANMSHEIRTPMNGVIGLTSLALDTELSKEQRQYLDGVMLSAEALLKIINDILDFSKIEAGRLELEKLDFDLRETLENTIRTLALRAHEKGLELLCDVRPEAPDALVGDPARLWQVLVNLVGNAIKFTQEGEVSVTVAVDSLNNTEVCLLFTVADTGIGIPADKQMALFKPFSQVDSSMTRKYGGTGLGLAISAQIVELMKGRIWFESELGKGSKFHFTACFDLRTTPLPKRAPLPPSGLDGLRVLVVDDNATNRMILRNMLTHWGMRPEDAEGGNVALQLLRDAHRTGEPFSLILLDVMMPVMDGFEVLERIRQMPEINRPVIMMLSSRDEPGDAARARELGAAAYIVKPIRPSELLDAIVNTLGISFEAAGERAAPATPAVGAEMHGPSLRILVAEDNPINQMLAVRILEKAGHSVAVAGNGEEALIAVGRESFDVVLMDVQMPVMDGFEATALIRQQEKATGRHLPIVAMTAHAMKGDREKCLEAGIDGYVAKPIQREELFGAITAAIPNKPHAESR